MTYCGMMGPVRDQHLLPSAQACLTAGRWTEACDLLTAVLEEGETAEALAGMGTALWWLGRIRESLDYRERAYAAYLAGREYAEAVMVAVDVSVSYLSNMDDAAVASGWIARAGRVAQRSGDEGLTGWLLLMQGYTAADPAEQVRQLSQALDMGRSRGDVDLELAALGDLGLAFVRHGRVADGLSLLDEAMAGTLAGEYERLDTVVWTSCSMLAACALVGDQRRAAQWCEAADRFSQKYGCPFLQVRCRSHYGSVLLATGDWALAEKEFGAALSMSADCGRAPRVEALEGLAELRLRQGALDEAERLLAEAGPAPDVAVVTAELLIARGRPEQAVAILRAESEAPPLILAALVDAQLATGDAEAAAATLPALELAVLRHPHASAAFHRACGVVAAATGDPVGAAASLRKAIAAYEELGLPFQAARTRFELARVVEPALAVVEAGRALGRLEQLGATRDAGQVAAFLRGLGVPTRPGPRQLGLLTRRECDVLALLRRGLTNPAIAAELYISPKTVGHHVSRILAKLNLSTRAEAAAYAAANEEAVRAFGGGPT